MSFDTTSTLTVLHLKSNSYFSLFFKDYELDHDLELSSNSFKLAFQCMLHLSASGPSRMIFEHLWDYFHLEDSTHGNPQLFQLCFHIARVLGAAHLLAMTKPLGGVRPIVVGESLYRFTSCVLCLQICETFVTHFFSHQFKVATKVGCETIIHAFWTFTLTGLFFNWTW
jgi:hypothetical protein